MEENGSDMEEKQLALHVKRLQAGLEQIPAFRQHHQIHPSDPDFKSWRDSILYSLAALFGVGHTYRYRFSQLQFDNRVVIIGRRPAPRAWGPGDTDKFNNGLKLTESILRDALEELDAMPIATEHPTQQTQQPAQPLPQIVVNVTNVLSQTNSIDIQQILAGLSDLNLSNADRNKAEEEGKLLEREVKGEARWPTMARSLEKLKALGQPVYERVALPLLLELLKKQTGV